MGEQDISRQDEEEKELCYNYFLKSVGGSVCVFLPVCVCVCRGGVGVGYLGEVLRSVFFL